MNHKICRVAIIIPAYNESGVIGDVITDLKRALNKEGIDYDIIVIDDCSSDRTAEIAQKSGVRVIKHLLNTGAGGATSTGLNYVKHKNYDYLITMDADGQHMPDDVVKGLNISIKNKTDLLIGSRLINAAGMSKTKILGNKGLSIMTGIIFGVKVTDSQSGLRILSKKAINSLSWRSTGYEFCSEMLWRANQSKLTISEYPIKAVYTEYSTSKGQKNWNAINIIKSLLRHRFMEIMGE